MAVTEKVIAFSSHDTRNVMNTQWPVTTTLTRVKWDHLSKPYWTLTYNICNGVAGGSKRFTRLIDALEALTAHTEFMTTSRTKEN